MQYQSKNLKKKSETISSKRKKNIFLKKTLLINLFIKNNFYKKKHVLINFIYVENKLETKKNY